MGLKEIYNKLSIYAFTSCERWPDAHTDPDKEVETKKLGPYQLNVVARLDDGHFTEFDNVGLPIRMLSRYDNNPVHLYSTLFCFGLANWSRYLATGSDEAASKFLSVADYVIKTGVSLSNGSLILKGPGKDGQDHCGPTDALDLGQALSVLCRAYQLTGDRKYLSAANGCSIPFLHSLEDQGVRSSSPVLNTIWYEEEIAPPSRHILNGMICALWGLRDLSIVSGSDQASELYTTGIDSVAKALPQFDTGRWSLYWVAEEQSSDYIATMNYHLLHIRQLLELHKQTGNDIFIQYAKRFSSYAEKAGLRFRALAANIHARMNNNSL